MKNKNNTDLNLSDSKEKIEVEGRIGRFFQKVSSLFKEDSHHTDTDLSGRIHELQANIDEVLEKLVNFKDKVKKEIDQEFRSSIDLIINFLLRESVTIQNRVERRQGPTLQVKAIKRYVEWLEKAKRWSELADKEYNREVVYKVLVEHTIEEFYLKIDRDIQVLQEYLFNSINNLPYEKQEKSRVQAGLELQLAPYFQKLLVFKELPKGLSLELKSFSAWRLIADRSREKTFTTALHMIDQFSEDFFIFDSKEDGEKSLDSIEIEESTELTQKLRALEEAVSQFLSSMEENKKINRSFISKLNSLEREAHNLNSNLRLSQNQVERVQIILDKFSSTRVFFNMEI